MSYKKFTVDNTTCSRRFHIAYDDESAKAPRVEIRCSYCGQVVFAEDNHPPVRMAREENLIKTSELSEILVTDCQYKDTLSEKTFKSAGINP